MQSDAIQVGSITIRYLVEGAESNGSVAVFEFDIPAQAKMPAPHSHDAYEETIYGLEGVSTWRVGEETIDVAPGDALCI